jgi:hypothetical protein
VTTIIAGVSLTQAAAENLRELGMTTQDIRRDVERVASGRLSTNALLALCLEGADPDREQGWHEYVDAVVLAARGTP